MTFYETLTEAVNDFIQNGFDSQDRLDYWIKRIRDSAIKELIPEYKIQEELEKHLNASYHRLVTKGGLVNKNVSRFTVDRLAPKLREELDRRILTSANLIKLNRQEAFSNVLSGDTLIVSDHKNLTIIQNSTN